MHTYTYIMFLDLVYVPTHFMLPDRNRHHQAGRRRQLRSSDNFKCNLISTI